MKQYELEKWEWTEEDFGSMGWHDCPIYAFKLDDKVCFDLDYILKWNTPDIEGLPYTYWISPSTLIFEDVSHLEVDFEMDFINGLEIQQIKKELADKSTVYKIDTQEGLIIVHSNSFKQIIRRKPTLQFGQFINDYERGGISFSEEPDLHFELTEDVKKKRKAEFDLYELSKGRQTLKNQLKNLQKDNLSTKDYLLQKRAIEIEIDKLNIKLKDTRFGHL